MTEELKPCGSLDDLCWRLRELSIAVTKADWSEFSMRVPVEQDRDADLVLDRAAREIERLREENKRLLEENNALVRRLENWSL